MKATILPTGSEALRETAMHVAAQHLARGEVVALPTETVYGLAGDATNPRAVAAIFAAKERPSFDPLIVHLPEHHGLEQVTDFRNQPDLVRLVRTLTERFWPGPLTLVLPAHHTFQGILTSGLPTVAVRLSAHPILTGVARILGRPLAAPSANRFGRITPTTAAAVMTELGERIGLILDAGNTLHGVESTIVAPAHDGQSMTLLRAGPITMEELAEYARVIRPERHVAPENTPLTSPGFLPQHYAPATPLLLVADVSHPHEIPSVPLAGCLAFRCSPPPGLYERVEILSPTGNLVEAAATLFSKLRRLDEAGLTHIIAELPPETGLGNAIRDRLMKAAGRGGEELPF